MRKHCTASSKISAANILPSKSWSLVRAPCCLLCEIMPSWILLLQFLNPMNFLSYTFSCWSSHFMISLWQYNQCHHYWRYSSVSKAIFIMKIRLLLCLPSFCERILSKYYLAVTVGFINQLSVWKRELRIHFWADITHVQGVLLKTTFWIKWKQNLNRLIVKVSQYSCYHSYRTNF